MFNSLVTPFSFESIDSVFLVILVVMLGLIIGSFLTVCTYRIPRQNHFYSEEPEAHQSDAPKFNDPIRSICPGCANLIKWYQNIPLFSWLMLRGKCAYCAKPISIRYPLIELITAIFALLSVHIYGVNLTALTVFLIAASLLVISVIDYDYFIIPNEISYPGIVVGFLLGLINQYNTAISFPITGRLEESLVGFLVGAGFLYLVSEVYLKLRKKEGLGLGDVKLLGMLGALLGAKAAIYTIFVGSLIGSICGVSMIMLGKHRLQQHIPFGPYLALGAYLYLFWYPDLFL
jgi:leader peptidase (prepilin peptidase)/N-methyltransferase